MERLETTVQRYNWAARRIIGAHGAGERIYSILFLFMLIFANNVQFARAAGTKTKTQLSPTITITQTDEQKTAIVGQIKYERPSLTIKDASGKLISRYFKLNWSFENGRDSVDANGREYTIDPNTGSVISKLYDGVTIGKKAGTAKVIVTLTIAPRYEDTYEFASGAQTSATYSIEVKSPKVTAEYYNGSTLLNGTTAVDLQFYAYNAGYTATTTCNMPTAKLYYELDKTTYDVTSYYDYTYSVTNGYTLSSDNKTISTTLNTEAGGSGTLTITATPKKKYQNMLGSTPIKKEIGLKTTYKNGKIRTYLSFSQNVVDALKYRNLDKNLTKDAAGESQKTYTPKYTVTDENGNDITNLVTTWNINWACTPQDVFKKYSHDPHDSINEMNAWYGALIEENTHNITVVSEATKNYGTIQHSRPDDYIVTATVSLSNTSLYETPVPAIDKDGKYITTTVEGQFYGTGNDGRTNKNNVYTLKSNQFVFREHKRVPKVSLSPEPNTVTLAEEYEMNAFNRFHITGAIVDAYDKEDPVDSASNFHYRFFLPDYMAYKNQNADPKNVQIEVTKTPAEYPGKSAFEWVPAYHNGEVQKNTDGTVKYEFVHGTYYECLYGYNKGYDTFRMKFHGTGENVPIVYTIVPWNPIKMDIGFSGVYQFNVAKKEKTHFVIDPKQQVNTVNTTIPCPDIKVEDQFGVDITPYFTVSKNKNSSEDKCTLNDDGSVTSSTPGTYRITVKGTEAEAGGSIGRYFENPDDDYYEMIFKQASTGSTAAYEVIYDATHNVKMGKLHFISAGDFFPGTTSYHEVPGINITFGSINDNANPWTLITSPKTDPSYFSDDTEFKGADNDKDWKDASTKTELSKESIEADAVTFDNNTNLPNGGGFLKIEAITNGWFYIDGNFQYNTATKTGRHYKIVDASTKEEQTIGYIKNPTTPEADNIAEVKFPKPLLAGHTYYVYSDDGGMRIHGLRFEPGFIDPVTDDLPWTHTGAVDLEPVQASTAFQNGLTGTLPTLAFHRQNEMVRWYCKDVKKDNTKTTLTTDDIVTCKDDEGKHVWIGNLNGLVSGRAFTDASPLNDATRTGYAKSRVRVYAEVKGIKKTEGQVMKTPEYYLFVGAMPTFIVQEGDNFDQGQRVSTTNIPTRIWMTFGGWEHTDKTYPYYKNNDPGNNLMTDEWKVAKMDSVGRNNQTIDGFTLQSTGGQNPADELVRGWDKGDRNTFNLPVRGTYLKFEPEESGRLLVYILQNGMTDNAYGNDEAKLTKNGPWLRRRALYIVDETGKPVDIDENSGWESTYNWDSYLNSGTTNADRFPGSGSTGDTGYHNWCLNYFCDGITRCAWNYDPSDATKHLAIWEELTNEEKAKLTADEKKDGKKYSWLNAYDRNHNGKLDDGDEKNNLKADYDKIKTWWTTDSYSYKSTDGKRTSNLSHTKLNGPLEAIQLSDSSFVLPTKGYMRYTFKVKAGKVYYVFMTGSKLGFCGFGFIPASYRANSSRWTDYVGEAKNGVFPSTTYANLPQPDDASDKNLYLAGKAGNNRLMGGDATIDVTKTSTEDGSYAKWKSNGYALSDESTSTNTARDFVNITLKRSFRNKRWAGICLPFTVSETQMKSIFGDDMQLITVDSVMASKDHERTLHFTQHVNQLLEAGRPYLIYPNVSGVTEGQPIGESSTSNGKTTYSVTFYRVTVQSVEPKTVIMKNEAVIDHNAAAKLHNDSITAGTATGEKMNKVNIFTYKVCGQYDKAEIPWYSYYMKNSESADDNKFYRIVKPSGSTATGRSLPGYNIYLFPYSTDPEGKDLIKTGETTSPAKIADFWITGAEVAGNSTTAIDEIVDDLNEATTAAFPGVYDLQGRQVRSTNDLKGLAPGIYLMGGHKYVVK